MRNIPYSSEEVKRRARLLAEEAAHEEDDYHLFRAILFYIIIPCGFLVAGFMVHRTSSEPAQIIQAGIKWASAHVASFGDGPEKDIIESAKRKTRAVLVSPIQDKIMQVGEKAVTKFDELKHVRNEEHLHDPHHGFVDKSVSRDDVLSDKHDRVSQFFKVSDPLHNRVAFWFDIYTKYSTQHEVIHHRDYPWVIYSVVDLRQIYESEDHKWTKYHRGQKIVQKEKAEVRRILRRLANRKNFLNLTEQEKAFVDMTKVLPGKNTRSKLRTAAKSIRAQLGQKDYFFKGLTYSNKYISQMEQIFAQYDLPVELTRIPLVESSFNPKAISKVGASGIWQFMPRVGSKFMKVTKGIDERNSPLKATDAAARLLLENFRILKSWPLAITAYNHGPGGVRRASRAARSKSIDVIIEKYSSRTFGFASKNFYAEFLAALYADRYQDEIFGPREKVDPLEYDEIKLAQSLRVREITDVTGMTLEELKLFNQDLKNRAIERNIFLPKGYNLHIPPTSKPALADYIYALQQKQRPPERTKYARVRPKKEFQGVREADNNAAAQN